ncbi:aminoglycoside 3'-phosphotransferase [Paenibacillus sp. FSL M8-0212]|uniref:aminoglycoside 3'-phosphotransferase n=1 Tax=Paenibacillus sp. FSL M8-0212 TaxID=2921618 RepID=UPI0030FB4BB3
MEMEGKNKLPQHIQNLIRSDDKVTFVWENIAQTFYIQSVDRRNKYLKIQLAGLAESLKEQSDKLKWCKNKLPVPEVIDHGISGEYEYLITLELSGLDASSETVKNNPTEIVEIVAHGLRTIHEISIEDCPFDKSMKQLMKIIKTKYQRGLLNSSLDESNVHGLIEELEVYFSDGQEDLVFTHGDFSMPNVIINNKRIEGYLDLGNCGVADRYYDLAVAENSIIRNYGITYIELFHNSYGLNKVDRQRIENYKLIEKLVWA